MKTKYGKPLREYLICNANPVYLVNFEDSQIFQSAIVETNILITQKSKWDKHLIATNVTKDFNNYQSLTDYTDRNGTALENPDINGWVIGDKATLDLKRKIEAGSIPIKNLNLSINFGIKTGYNEAFIIDEETKRRLCREDPKSINILKPLLRGRDTQKWYHNFANKWLINSHNGIKIKGLRSINVVHDYPAIYEHLKKYQKKLEERQDKGNHWTNLRNCAYLEDFDKEKIIWGELSDKPKFAYDAGRFYEEATLFIMTGGEIKYLLAILNSQLSAWYFNLISTSSGMGTNRWKKYKIELFPIKNTSKSEQQPFVDIVNKILELNNNDDYSLNPHKQSEVREYEKQIDKFVYELYRLTPEEVALVEKESQR